MLDVRPIEPTSPAPSRAWWRQPVLAGLWAAPALYAILVLLQPSDRFGAWHDNIVWPARHFLTDGTPGIVLPLFAFFMIGGVGTLFATLLVLGIMKVIGLILPLPRLGEWLGVALLLGMPVWAFVWVKAVPQTVTVIARDPARLEVHRFGTFTRWPAVVQVIPGEQIIGLDLFTGWEGRTRTLSLKVGALTRSSGAVVLAARECSGGRKATAIDACLASGEPDLLELARALDLVPAGAIDRAARPGHRLLRVGPASLGSAAAATP